MIRYEKSLQVRRDFFSRRKEHEVLSADKNGYFAVISVFSRIKQNFRGSIHFEQINLQME